MEQNEILIGSHVSMNAPDFFLSSVKEAISYDSTAFMLYTGAPQNSFRKPLNELKIQEGLELLKTSKISQKNIIVHAPYIINPANRQREDLIELTEKMLINELKRTKGIGSSILVLHPGSHVNQGEAIGLKALVDCLDIVLSQDGTDVKIALETMAGKGSEIGINFEQIQFIISNSKYPERLGVCMDTCHLNDGGFNIKDFDNILDQFEKIIGINKLLVIHLNDTKNELGSHKDRHENIGYGFIGFDALNAIVHNSRLKQIPKILETPYINGVPPYKKEIQMLKEGKFEQNWKENFNL